MNELLRFRGNFSCISSVPLEYFVHQNVEYPTSSALKCCGGSHFTSIEFGVNGIAVIFLGEEGTNKKKKNNNLL